MTTTDITDGKAKRLWLKTPLVESTNLSKAAGWYVSVALYDHITILTEHSRILLKLDNLQPSGAFKSRGLGNFCAKALEASPNPDRAHFYSSSGGNAGLACVTAANALSRPSTVVVPLSTKPMMIAKIRAAGASEVIQKGNTWQDADIHLREVVMEAAKKRGETVIYVSPFNHPDVWRGHETVIEEIQEQFEELGESGQPEVVICSVGGGGLLCGVLQGLEKAGWNRTTVVAVETEGAASLATSLKQGEHITLSGITSQATTLGAVRIADRAFELATQAAEAGRLKSAVLSDAEAAMGCWRFADDERFLVELSCGVNLALCYGGRLEKALGRPIKPDDRVVIEVCGGSMVSTELVEQWRREFGLLNDQVSEVVPSATTAP